MQVLEWRITAPNNKNQCPSENRLPFGGNNLLSHYVMKSGKSEMMSIEPAFSLPKVRFTWTGNKVDLVELIYAWEAAGCFNHGHVNIKEIVIYIEVVFNIDLGDYYHTFRDLRRRVNRTAFLDNLIKHLIERMDKADQKK
ncbi:RteC domain-containing protein [Bacteroidales bacterium OttesenSCG-928-L03]|nr:RteC domain-containing protein [Bacteroidales bacterium OttesenSCG-928-L03]